jgi:membrane peptidoglycan carboxypeptidase
VQNSWRRAEVKFGAAGRLAVMAVVAALLAAAVVLPFVAIAGIATRDAADTFYNLPVSTLGTAPARSVIYDAEGRPLAYFYPNDVYRVPVSYNQIAPIMRQAIVAIEDNAFFHEGALDPRGTLRAVLHNSGGGGLQGASTLAQQYVKNVRILQASTPAEQREAYAPTLQRKVQDLRVAANVEHEMTPDQLLAAYLNVAFFSNHAWGIQVASEVYFSKPASQLTLPEAALLAGIVQDPTEYNPVLYPGNATARRNTVLATMVQSHYISAATASAAEKMPLGLHLSAAPLNTGCLSPQAGKAAFFCDYVQHVLEHNFPTIWNAVNTTGGLAIYTTLNMRDQVAAEDAVDYVEPRNDTYNPGHNADTEVLIQPGTGAVRAIAVNRKFGSGRGEDDVDYAVNSEYGGSSVGVQTGSSSKIFTLITALSQGFPLGHTISITDPMSVGPFYNCQGVPTSDPTGPPGFFSLQNAEAPFKGHEVWQLNLATVASVNVYFANLEKQVGLCNVVKTAAKMGMTRADGTSLLKYDKSLGSNGYSADNDPSFTLGSVGVSPMDMAAAYASVAANGRYCSPKAITKVVDQATGKTVLAPPNHCYRDMSAGVASAANYILQGVLDNPSGTAFGQGIGRPAAAKTGTANGGFYAAFAGYTPTLAGYVSVFNPLNPTGSGAMVGSNSDYRAVDGALSDCGGQMFGACAPAATWQMTFLHAALGRPLGFNNPPGRFFSEGNGLGAPKTIGPKKKPHHGKTGPGRPTLPPTGPGH